MSITEKILLGVALGYVAIGAILSLFVGLNDLRKSRVSVIGFLDSLVGISGFFQLLYLLLWPFWYFAYRAAEKKDQQRVAFAYGSDQTKYLKKEPNQSSQPTPPSGVAEP